MSIELPSSGGLYLFHFEPRYQHAGHYLGYARSIARRVGEHYSGGARSSPLVRAALGVGCTVEVVRVWHGLGRGDERRMKRGGGLSRYCPVCRETGSFHR